MKFQGRTNEFLQLEQLSSDNCHILKERIESGLTFIWFPKGGSILLIDGKTYNFEANDIVCLTEFHKIEVVKLTEAKMVRFNRSFYCILDHDNEVGCKGILFFGATTTPVINLPSNEVEKFSTLWRMFEIEMQSQDRLQLEMLQMMLKRLIILTTRLYKEQEEIQSTNEKHIDLVREFNFLVEQHFKEKHTVAEYADLLYKSPKTLSNTFAKVANKTPLQFIKERRMLEARRLLHYTDMSIKEVAYEIGFDDVQSFSRFFKQHEGVSPTAYAEKIN